MTVIQYAAAGGIIVRGAEALLLRKVTKGEWVLPKGHVEAGETLADAALRETREETGYLNLQLLAELGTLRSEFPFEGRRILRDETYFVMALLDEARATAPTHADAARDQYLFERHWWPLNEAAERLSFEPARTFMRRAAAWAAAER